MTEPPDRLEAYHFHEEEWASFEELADAFEWEVPERFNVASYVCDRWAEASPDRLALLVAGGADDVATEVTYGDLRRRANRLANALAERGVGRGDRVVVHGPQAAETLVAFVATWKLGARLVPTSPLLGADELERRLAETEASAVVAAPAGLDALRSADRPNSLESALVAGDAPIRDGEEHLADAVEGHDATFETADTTAEDVATIIYTSGTTGPPKGVLLPHRVLLGHLPQFATIIANLGIGPDDLLWTPAEWTWVASVYIRTLPALCYGVPILAADRGGAFEPAEAFHLVDEHGVTMLGAAPTALRMMAGADRDGYDLSSVRIVSGGGEDFGEDVREWAGEAFGEVAVNGGYGQTEANGLIGDCVALAPHRPGKTGLAGIGHDVRIVDPETVEPLPAGEVGEIAVRVEGDPVVSTGYLDRPEAMAEKRRNGFHLTGDLGTVDEDGYFAVEGRKDELILSAGYRVGPEEVEAALLAHPSVAAAGVVGVHDEVRGEVPKAFVVPAEGAEPSAALREALQEHVKNQLAKYEYPRELEFVETLPTTRSGKVDRSALQDRVGE